MSMLDVTGCALRILQRQPEAYDDQANTDNDLQKGLSDQDQDPCYQQGYPKHKSRIQCAFPPLTLLTTDAARCRLVLQNIPTLNVQAICLYLACRSNCCLCSQAAYRGNPLHPLHQARPG